jgi:hypothetical protein
MKIIYVVLIAFILTAEMPAQFKFGIEVGLNISKIKGSDPSIIGGGTGILLGINANYHMLDFLSVESGLYLSQKGADRIIYPNIQGAENYNYLELPLNLVYKLPITGGGMTSVLAGVYTARLLSANITPDNQGQSSAVNLEELIPASDYGLNFGIRQSFNISSGLLNFGIKYTIGLKSIDEQYNVIKYGEHIISDGTKKLYNSVVAVTAGYTF